ncbi:perforin-1-like [Chanos chanos]|uniref:Perforin-1-like n=1 Tax=Chanos chanos TaxID=29144 RepID=A0A6J2WMA7_CHACN|nr:perforin-1-like [Chanos chanos]
MCCPALLWTVLLALPLSTSQSCTQAKKTECEGAEFAPGSNLAGEGFDITKMQRKGAFVIDMNKWQQKDKTCTLCGNPYMENKKQKLPVSVVDWRPSHKCSMKVSSTLYQTSEALVSSTTSSIENNWKADLGLETSRYSGSLMLGGTNSKMAEYSMEKTKKDKFSFTSHRTSCEYYSYRLSSTPSLHIEFKREYGRLPKSYNDQTKHNYYKLIDKFGTHYLTKVTLGGTVHSVTSIQQCQAALNGLSTDEVKTCLDVEASASVTGKGNSKAEFHHCKEAKDKTESKSSFSSRYSDRFTEISGGHTTEPDILFSADKDPNAYKQWLSSVPQNPDVISYSLESLHELLPKKQPIRQHLRKAITDYIVQRGLWKNCSEPCKAGIKTNPKESCVCSCHNNPKVTLNCCPRRKGLAEANVTVIRASGLWGDYLKKTDGYVKVLHKGKVKLDETPVIYNNNAPHWGRTSNLGTILLADFGKLRLEVWDRDNKWDDDLLGACEIDLKHGVQENFCSLNHGILYYKVQVSCGPSLSGPTCSEYVPSPIPTHLEKMYVSRHAQRVPKKILVGMGVLLNEHVHYYNQSRALSSYTFRL